MGTSSSKVLCFHNEKMNQVNHNNDMSNSWLTRTNSNTYQTKNQFVYKRISLKQSDDTNAEKYSCMNNQVPKLSFNKDKFFIKHSEDIVKDQTFIKHLGSGSFAQVCQYRHKKLGSDKAVKILSNKNVSHKKMFINEMQLMRDLDHPNIININEIFMTSKNCYLVMDLCTGGNLLENLTNGIGFPENEALSQFEELLSAVAYLHKKKIIHLDIKPENILFANSNMKTIKIIDFGLSNYLQCIKHCGECQIGSLAYMSPESLNFKRYTEKHDCWSLGVILQILLSGIPPFYGCDQQIKHMIKQCKYHFDYDPFYNISYRSKDLIKKLLTFNPENRLSCEEALEHSCFKSKITKAIDYNDIPIGFFEEFKKHVNQPALKKVAKMMLTACTPYCQKYNHFKLFKQFDTKNDGVIDFEEFIRGIKNIWHYKNISIKEIGYIFNSLTSYEQNSLTITEFSSALLYWNNICDLNCQDCCIRFVFDYFSDNNKYISVKTLSKVLGENNQKSKLSKKQIIEVEAILLDIESEDGKIDYQKFYSLMKNNT